MDIRCEASMGKRAGGETGIVRSSLNASGVDSVRSEYLYHEEEIMLRSAVEILVS